MSRHALLLAPASLAVAAVVGLSGGAASATEACGQPAVPAVYQTVHHDAITTTVPGTSTTTWLWTRQVATTERQLSTVVVDQPAQPGVPEQGHSVTTTTVLTWTYVQQTTGKTRCVDSPTWNAGDNGKGWDLVGPCDTSETTTWVVDTPAVPAVPEVSHVEYVWVAEGDSAPAGYDATGATRPGTPVTENADRSATAPDGDGWTQLADSAETTTTTPDTVDVVTPAWDEQVLVSPAVPATAACSEPGTEPGEPTDPSDPTDPTDPSDPVANPDPGIVVTGPAVPVLTTGHSHEVVAANPQVAAVTLVHASHASHAAPAASGPTLPNTGNPIDPWLLALGASLVVAGTGVVIRARR
ncbi:MAG TPA: LPXTG cell wall anchor domain-containing protein [Nocardioides sp.]|nr:LPXTG cell wall anchor domain-containing protein [Nocardioides sp.]